MLPQTLTETQRVSMGSESHPFSQMQFAPLPPPFPKPASLPWERLATRQHDVMVMTGPVTGVIKASPGISAMKEERHYPLCADGAAPPAHWLAELDPAAAGCGPESAPPPPSGPPGMFALLGACSVQGNLTCLFPRHLLDLAARERPAPLTHSLKFFRFFFWAHWRTKQPGCREMSSCICGSSVQGKKETEKKKTGREAARFEKVAEG